MRYFAQKQLLKVSVRISRLMLLQWSMSKSENWRRVAMRGINLQYLMSKLSEQVQQRLKSAQELLEKVKARVTQSTNFTKVVVTYRKENMLEQMMLSSSKSSPTHLMELMANNNVKMYEVKRMVKRRLQIGEAETIQLFLGKKIISDLGTTVGELRREGSSEPLQLQVTKMEVF